MRRLGGGYEAAGFRHSARRRGGSLAAARAYTQHGKMPVVGVLWHAGSAEEEDVYLVVLRKAFSDLGYVLAADVRCGS